jgi:succinate dehydrogenase/fumarate reductase flavoprotein subunit
MSNKVSRRAFLRTAATGAASATALSMAATALAAEPPTGDAEGEEGEDGGMMQPMMTFGGGGYDPADYPDPASWRVAPDPIADDQISEEYTADVVIVGHGHYGINCARYLCDNSDKSVILIEAQDEDTFAPVGNEWTQLNSQFGFDHAGFPEYDPIEFQQNWMLLAGNIPNQQLVMNYAQYSGAATDQFLQDLTDEDIATITYNFNDYRDVMLDHLGAVKFYNTCVSPYGACNQTKIHAYNREACKAKGAQFFFSTHGEQLIQDEDGCVTGVIAKDTNDDHYTRFNANVAVVLATGGFGANGNMALDLLTDLKDALVPGELISCMMDYDGSGIQMGYWAGGKIQPGAIATMNGKHASAGSPQQVWLDSTGRRYCNEFIGSVEHRGRAGLFMPREDNWVVYDANYPDHMVAVLPQHMASEPSEANIESARTAIQTAYEAGSEGSNGTYAADTLEEAMTWAGMPDDVKAAALAQIEEYNQYCADGADQQFGRDAAVLFPVDTAPFVVKKVTLSPGSLMVTNGGLETNGNCQVVDEEYKPIPGLFAGGNTGGNRFGYDYFTPGPGVSIGTCVTLGYCTGKYIAENL